MISKKIEQIKQYPPYRRWHAIAYMLFFLGCILICLCLLVSIPFGQDSIASAAFGYAAIICVIVHFLINFLFWRCPKCNKTLPVFGPVLVCNICEHVFVDDDGNPKW